MSNQDFNTFKIYSKVADILQKTDPVIAYYLKTYNLNKALEYLKGERSKGNDVSEKTNFIKQWLGDLEELKGTLSNQLVNKDQCKHQFCEYTLNLFNKSDQAYKTGNLSQELAKDFLYVSVLLDAWEILGVPSDGIKEKKNYANDARFKIMNALTKGGYPAPPVKTEHQEPTKPSQNQADQKTNNPQPTQPTQQTQPTQPTQQTPLQKLHNNGETPGGPEETKHDGETPAPSKTEHVDPLAKINFQLTESIVVPQHKIDKFLEPGKDDVASEQNDPSKNHPISNFAGKTEQQNPNRWNLPVGKSVALDTPVDTNPGQQQNQGKEQVQNPNVNNPHDVPQYDFQRRKTPETIFYAPRAGPSMINNIKDFQQHQDQKYYQDQHQNQVQAQDQHQNQNQGQQSQVKDQSHNQSKIQSQVQSQNLNQPQSQYQSQAQSKVQTEKLDQSQPQSQAQSQAQSKIQGENHDQSHQQSQLKSQNLNQTQNQNQAQSKVLTEKLDQSQPQSQVQSQKHDQSQTQSQMKSQNLSQSQNQDQTQHLSQTYKPSLIVPKSQLVSKPSNIEEVDEDKEESLASSIQQSQWINPPQTGEKSQNLAQSQNPTKDENDFKTSKSYFSQEPQTAHFKQDHLISTVQKSSIIGANLSQIENADPNMSFQQNSQLSNMLKEASRIGGGGLSEEEMNRRGEACEEAKKYCAMAIAELNYVKIQDAREKIKQALAILDKIDPTQSQSFLSSKVDLL